MPNWCENELTVIGPAGKLAEFKAKVRGIPFNDDKEEALCADNLIPYPEKFKELDRIAKQYLTAHPDDWQNRPKDGFNSGGYQWCRDNWGTKWGFCYVELVTDEPETLVYTFDTAWSPPEPLIRKMAEMFPDLDIRLEYWEGGGGFTGSLGIEQGKVVSDVSGEYA